MLPCFVSIIEMCTVVLVGFRNTGSLSFASVTSRAKPAVEEGLHMSKVNESGKKGKKSSRVLLSTAGGRRY